MLVLSRKTDQTIHIGDQIKVTILKIRNNCVKVGVEAPQRVNILRGELESNELGEAHPQGSDKDSNRLLVSVK
ncbi:carbon storage regulator [Adhaeretor mobilis]|uniref:Translational regulator CsrA n=1 Tax=Adhaeretor mobilis TaxID=1930276 RepID=A0A517MPS8_9BACT|nr:carbon storage regulator [Adhaeretor mobilis]QDS96888.1 Carbon storage regulator [Adhaeretor mobilis]